MSSKTTADHRWRHRRQLRAGNRAPATVITKAIRKCRARPGVAIAASQPIPTDCRTRPPTISGRPSKQANQLRPGADQNGVTPQGDQPQLAPRAGGESLSPPPGNWAVKKMAPVRAALSRKMTALPAEKARERNSRIGSIGAWLRLSTATNTDRERGSEDEWRRAPVRFPTRSWSIAPAPRRYPDQTCSPAPRPGGRSAPEPRTPRPIRDSTSGIAKNTNGTLIQKIHCHEMPCVTAPPTTGPSSAASPLTLPYTPAAQPRRSGGKTPFIMASASGMIVAAPAP